MSMSMTGHMSMSSQCQVNVSQSVSHQSPVVVMSAMYIMLIKMWLYHYDNYQWNYLSKSNLTFAFTWFFWLFLSCPVFPFLFPFMFLSYPLHFLSFSYHFLSFSFHVPFISFHFLSFSFHFLSFSFHFLSFFFHFPFISFHFLSFSFLNLLKLCLHDKTLLI